MTEETHRILDKAKAAPQQAKRSKPLTLAEYQVLSNNCDKRMDAACLHPKNDTCRCSYIACPLDGSGQ